MRRSPLAEPNRNCPASDYPVFLFFTGTFQTAHLSLAKITSAFIFIGFRPAQIGCPSPKCHPEA
jgi:hypothetical protein